MTPFIGQQTLWEQISNPYDADGDSSTTGDVFQSMGPYTLKSLAEQDNNGRYEPWLTIIGTSRDPRATSG